MIYFWVRNGTADMKFPFSKRIASVGWQLKSQRREKLIKIYHGVKSREKKKKDR